MLRKAAMSYSSSRISESQARMLYQRRIEKYAPQTVTFLFEDDILSIPNGGLFISSKLKQEEKFSNSSQSYRTVLSQVDSIQDAVRQKSARVENNAQNPAW